MGFLTKLLKLIPTMLPFLGGLFGKQNDDSARAAELRAERDIIEAKAFAKGRLSPAYLKRYAYVFIFVVFSVFVLLRMFTPDLVPGDPLEALGKLAKAGESFFGEWW